MEKNEVRNFGARRFSAKFGGLRHDAPKRNVMDLVEICIPLVGWLKKIRKVECQIFWLSDSHIFGKCNFSLRESEA